MKVILDPYRGGNDTGVNINGKYEKNLLLDLTNYFSEQLSELGIKNEIIRTSDVSLTDDERNSIINELKNDRDIIIQNRYIENSDLEIIYPLRNDDALASLISNELTQNGINVEKYYQRRLPSNTVVDYYNIIRNTDPNETLIISFPNLTNYQNVVSIIARAIASYIKEDNTYKVVKGDSLYKIAKMYDISVEELKEVNKLSSNLLNIGQVLIIPTKTVLANDEYLVKKGDSLYQIAKMYGITVNELKELNNLSSNLLSIGQILKVPQSKEDNSLYSVKKGDSLYQIAKTYGITVNELKELNNLSSNLLSIGQILKVPQSTEEYSLYSVKKGDSLYQIAKKYNLTVNELKNINGLSNNLLSIGQVLKIPK